MDLYQQYRPKTLGEVVGQSNAINTLIQLGRTGKLPQALLLTGPSGVGKTTIARILRDKQGCKGSDYQEINCAQDGGIDKVKEVQQHIYIAPLYGKCRIWYFDECQSWARTPYAQQAALKLFEDSPSHCRFILATTDPSKLLKTIITRCLEVKLEPIQDSDLADLIKRVATAEKIDLTEPVIVKLVDLAGGSARQVLQNLQKIANLKTEGERLTGLEPPEIKKQAFDLVRALIWQRAKWPEVLTILKRCPIEDTEAFRHLVLACANTELLKGGATSKRAWQVCEGFKFPLWDWKEAAVATICYELTNTGG